MALPLLLPLLKLHFFQIPLRPLIQSIDFFLVYQLPIRPSMIFVFFHDGVNGRVVDFLLPRHIFHGHAMHGYEIDEVDSFLVVESYLLPRLHTPHKLFLMPRMPMNCIRTSIAANILFNGLISNHIIDIEIDGDTSILETHADQVREWNDVLADQGLLDGGVVNASNNK